MLSSLLLFLKNGGNQNDLRKNKQQRTTSHNKCYFPHNITQKNRLIQDGKAPEVYWKNGEVYTFIWEGYTSEHEVYPLKHEVYASQADGYLSRWEAYTLCVEVYPYTCETFV